MTAPPAAVEALGWVATAVFVASYFFRRPEALARAQMAGALLWATYGVLMQAPPVIAANVLVLAAAAWKSRRAVPEPRPGAAAAGDAVQLTTAPNARPTA